MYGGGVLLFRLRHGYVRLAEALCAEAVGPGAHGPQRMKTIIKLMITLALLNAAGRAGMAAWRYYQLKDAAQQMVTFGAQVSTTDLHNRILEKAAELSVPLPPEGVNVHRQGIRTWAEAVYTQPVEYFPNRTYPVRLSFSVDAYSMSAGPDEEKK